MGWGRDYVHSVKMASRKRRVITLEQMGAPVSGPLLKEKALQLFPSIYPESSAQSFVADTAAQKRVQTMKQTTLFFYLAHPDS